MYNTIYSDKKPSKNSTVDIFITTVAEYKDYMGGVYIDEIKSPIDLINNEHAIISDLFYRIYEINDNKTSYIKEFWDLTEARIFFKNITKDNTV